MRHQILSTLVVSFWLVSMLNVEAQASDRPQIIVAPQATVYEGEITLGDIARIHSKHEEHEELLRKLKNISLGLAPEPRLRTTIPGVKILNAIQAQGIPTEEIAYSIPHVVDVLRAGRVLETTELLPVIREALSKQAHLDVQVREVRWQHAQVIPEGDVQFKVSTLGPPARGKIPLRVLAIVHEKPAARFLATALVDDWREVPVLNRTIDRGMLIRPDDIELVRLNLFKQPADVANSSNQVVGRRARNRIEAGKTIRKGLLDIPPMIPRGQRVMMRYSSGGLTITASGVAMEDGHEGSQIDVRNLDSKRVVRARVMEKELVEVESE